MLEVKERGLNVRGLLADVVSGLEKKFEPKIIKFPQKVLTEIADDSDYHRTRIGYMGYERAGLYRFQDNQRTWVIARGIACGDYPADPYDSDILAFPCRTERKSEEDIEKEIKKEIETKTYFRSSLIFGMSDGHLAASKLSVLGREVAELLKKQIGEYVAQEVEYEKGVIGWDLRPITKVPMLYKPKFVDFIVHIIEKILRENRPEEDEGC